MNIHVVRTSEQLACTTGPPLFGRQFIMLEVFPFSLAGALADSMDSVVFSPNEYEYRDSKGTVQAQL